MEIKNPFTNIQQIFGEAKKIQEKIGKIKEELADRTVEASVGGGMVCAVVNGCQELIDIRLEPEVFADSDKEMLRDLIVAAVNEALKRSKALAQEEMSKATYGVSLPGITDII